MSICMQHRHTTIRDSKTCLKQQTFTINNNNVVKETEKKHKKKILQRLNMLNELQTHESQMFMASMCTYVLIDIYYKHLFRFYFFCYFVFSINIALW